jgi:cell division protease FtsH
VNQRDESTPARSRGATSGSRTPLVSRRLALLLGLLVVFGGAYAAAVFTLQPSSPGKELTIDQVVHGAQQHAIPEARFLDEDARVTGQIILQRGQAPAQFWTAYPRSDAATNDLLNGLVSGGAHVNVDPQTGKAIVRFLAQFLLPLMILADLFALLFVVARGSGGASTTEFLRFGGIGKRQVGGSERRRTTFTDVAAADEAVEELAEVRDFLSDPRAFQAMGATPPRGVLLTGPPGCGKTLLARAVAGEADASFYSVSGSEFVESLVGIGAARVRDLFRQAREATPSIIFIDELDAVGRQRGAGLGGGHDEREQTLNELLVQMDGFDPSDGVVVVGASNRPDILDPALLRAGRFERRIVVDRPDREGRLQILKLHAATKRLADAEADLPHLASRTSGCSGADLASILNEAALLAVREKATSVNRALLEEGLERAFSGPRRRSRVLGADERRRIATHEAGHAVVAAALGWADRLDKVSIIARGRGIGHLALLQDDAIFQTREDLGDRITVAMAGVAAEEMALGQPSTGNEEDLERATNCARDMVGRYGMSERIGRVRVLNQREVFIGRDYLHAKDVSQPKLERIDDEVRSILDDEEARALAILNGERSAFDALVTALVAGETVAGAELRAILGDVRPAPMVVPRSLTRTAAESR